MPTHTVDPNDKAKKLKKSSSENQSSVVQPAPCPKRVSTLPSPAQARNTLPSTSPPTKQKASFLRHVVTDMRKKLQPKGVEVKPVAPRPAAATSNDLASVLASLKHEKSQSRHTCGWKKLSKEAHRINNKTNKQPKSKVKKELSLKEQMEKLYGDECRDPHKYSDFRKRKFKDLGSAASQPIITKSVGRPSDSELKYKQMSSGLLVEQSACDVPAPAGRHLARSSAPIENKYSREDQPQSQSTLSVRTTPSPASEKHDTEGSVVQACRSVVTKRKRSEDTDSFVGNRNFKKHKPHNGKDSRKD